MKRNELGQTLSLAFRGCRRFLYCIPRKINREHPREVVLLAQNPLMLNCLLPLAGMFQGDSRVRVRWTIATGCPEIDAMFAMAESVGLEHLRASRIPVTPIDLVIAADHVPRRQFHPSTGIALIYHAIDASKTMLTDHSILYRDAAQYTIKNGNPFYTKVFEPNFHRIERLREVSPALAERGCVVGSLMADELFAMDSERKSIRAQLGFSAADHVVLIGSTHGDDSLIEAIGRELIDQCEDCPDNWRFIVSVHPTYWDATYPSAVRDWLCSLQSRRYLIHQPPEAWSSFLVACDAALVDFGSMATGLALLRRPLAMTMFNNDLVREDSAVGRLARIVPRVEHLHEFERKIEQAKENGTRQKVDAIANELVSFPGDAHRRISENLYSLLALEKPERMKNT